MDEPDKSTDQQAQEPYKLGTMPVLITGLFFIIALIAVTILDLRTAAAAWAVGIGSMVVFTLSAVGDAIKHAPHRD